jgi:hypothetical protein
VNGKFAGFVRPALRLTLLLALLLLAAACGATHGSLDPNATIGPSSGSEIPISSDTGLPIGVLPPDSMSLSINNGTTLTLSLVVNGTPVASLEPATCLGCGPDGGVPASLLPPLPWHAEALTSSGRVLSSLDVRAGDVIYMSGGSKGVGSRVDLSCGRLDIWSGPPIDGPSPGAGTPGDCKP